jgi:uncharacterized protein YbdZ (MbtH family)
MYKLDYSKKQVLQLSNDAFFYLKEEEEPLDEDNLDEANEIISMFPKGFHIDEGWKYVEDSDMVEATFIPYIDDDWQFDEYIDLFNGWQLQVKWTDDRTQVEIRYYNPTKEPFGQQICDVSYNQDGKPMIWTKEGSMYPLWKDVKKCK